jgi:hypothetical protein
MHVHAAFQDCVALGPLALRWMVSVPVWLRAAALLSSLLLTQGDSPFLRPASCKRCCEGFQIGAILAHALFTSLIGGRG